MRAQAAHKCTLANAQIKCKGPGPGPDQASAAICLNARSNISGG
jgi:hypothetical protein